MGRVMGFGDSGAVSGEWSLLLGGWQDEGLCYFFLSLLTIYIYTIFIVDTLRYFLFIYAGT